MVHSVVTHIQSSSYDHLSLLSLFLGSYFSKCIHAGEAWHKVNEEKGRGCCRQDQGSADAVRDGPQRYAAAIDGSAEVD